MSPSPPQQQQQRTIQVKIGNQAARAMTPDQAAEYLKTIAGKGGWGPGRELKMTFDNGSTSTVSLPRERATTTRADGMPCSEKEMKALMSMFVEIMGLQMNTERLNQKVDPSNTSNLFLFPNDVPPPPGGWPAAGPPVPALEDIPAAERTLRNGLIPPVMTTVTTTGGLPPKSPTPFITGASGIAAVPWYALERAAIEDALEQEERIRKDAPHHKKKKRIKLQAAAALLKVEAANKKLTKAVIVWRNGVAAAIAQNDTTKLQVLLKQAPTFSPQQAEQWEPLVPLAGPKNWSKGSLETRLMLSKYMLEEFSENCMFTIGRADGRSVVHSACLYADVPLLQLVLRSARDNLSADHLTTQLLEPCQDSGWTPLHYAALSGSTRTVETVFSVCADNEMVVQLCGAPTNPTQTWKKGTNRGLSPTALAEAMISGKTDKLMESHGIALQEIADHFKVNTSPTKTNLFVHLTGFLYCRILAAETSGYVALSETEIDVTEREFVKRMDQNRPVDPAVTVAEEEEEAKESDDESNDETQQNKKKKKKKRKKKKAVAVEDPGPTTPVSTKDNNTSPHQSESLGSVKSPTEDPLISALIGMGFEYDQVMDGIEACGGMSRATADDVVAWIFSSNDQTREAPPAPAVKTISKDEAEQRNAEAARKLEEEKLAAEKLAAKKEEQRRRNREWNNRAQVRQAMEAQGKVAKAQLKARGTTGLRTGIAPLANTLGRGNSLGPQSPFSLAQTINPSEILSRKPTRLMGGVNLGGQPTVAITNASETGMGVYSNEASTVASSLEHFEVEVGGNDDATVSTMGSFPAVPAPSLPPGFGSGQAATTNDTLPAQQWESQRPPMPGQLSHLSSGAMGSLIAPPGIPESGPLLDRPDLPSSQRSQSFTVPSVPNRVPPSQCSFSTSVYPEGSSNLLGSHNTSSAGAPSESLSTGLGGSFLSDGFGTGMGLERNTSSPGGFVQPLPPLGNGVPGLLGFGSDMKSSPQLESAIIDSISTGNTAIGTSALWNDTAAPGSSLLGSLIDNNNADAQPLFTSSSSFNSNDNKNHPSNWNPDVNPGGGSSIW